MDLSRYWWKSWGLKMLSDYFEVTLKRGQIEMELEPTVALPLLSFLSIKVIVGDSSFLAHQSAGP